MLSGSRGAIGGHDNTANAGSGDTGLVRQTAHLCGMLMRNLFMRGHRVLGARKTSGKMQELCLSCSRSVFRLSVTLIAIFGGQQGASAPQETFYQEVLFVQVGAFKRSAGATSLANELEHKGFPVRALPGNVFYRVVVGPFSTESEAMERVGSVWKNLLNRFPNTRASRRSKSS